MRKSKKTLAILAIVAMVLMLIPVQAFAGTTTATSRLAGTDRIGTALAIAQQGWTSGSTNVIVAPADDANLVDALAVAPLAGQLKAPILLTYKASLSSRVQTEIATLKATNIYAVGALSSTVISQLKAISGVTVTPLQGLDRTNTAADISAQLTNPAGTFVVGYNGLPDALSVASYAAANDYAIVVANPDGTVPSSEKIYGSKTYVLGGPTLVQDISGATRLAGTDRYGTNTQVLTTLSYKYDNVYVANGETLVDALAGSSLAAQTNAPIVLGNTLNNTVAAPAASAVAGNITSSTKVIALGGTGVVPDSMVSLIANGQGSVTPPTTVSISSPTVTGQTTGTGAANAPAIATVNSPVTVSATVTGAGSANITYLVTSSSNITATTAGGQTIPATTLTSPIVIGNDTFGASYSVPADGSGNVSLKFVSSASSNQPFNVVLQTPYNNNGQPIQSSEVRMQWGLPGSLVLSPMYGNSADQLNFSNSSSSTRGLVALVATILPGSSSASLAGQPVQFTMNNVNNDGTSGASVYFTDANGVNMVSAGAFEPGNGSSITYNVNTDANGQAVVYVNANQPTSNSTPVVGAWVNASFMAQLVNGGGSTGVSNFRWQTYAFPSQVANVSPAQALNASGATSGVAATNAETATSGSQVTLSGTLQDAAGNPVPNTRIVVQDYDVTNGYSNNLQSDSFIAPGSTTPTLFSATAYPVLTTDASGNFSVTVSATIPVTQQVIQSETDYYVYFAPPTVSLANGQSLQPGSVTPMSIVGDGNKSSAGNNYLAILWQQGQTVQAVGVGHDVPLSQYSDLQSVPSNYQLTRMVNNSRSLYAGAYNQNAQLVVPSSSNQFNGYTLNWTVTTPLGIYLTAFDGVNFAYAQGTTAATAPTSGTLNVPFQYVTGVKYTVGNDGACTLTEIDGNSTASTGTGYTPSQALPVSFTMPTVASGMPQFKVNNTPQTNANGVSGTVNVSVSAYNGSTAEGGASGTIPTTFNSASALTTLGLAPTIQNLTGYAPLLTENAPRPAIMSESGTGYGTGSETSSNNPNLPNPGNVNFLVAPFNSLPNLASIPTQGLTYTFSATKSGEVHAIDGYSIQGNPASASMTIQSSGAVSINNVPVFPAGTVAYGYDANKGSVYYLTLSGSTVALNLLNGTANPLMSWNGVTLPATPDLPLQYDVNGSTLTISSSNGGVSATPAVTTATSSATAPFSGDISFVPSQIASLNISDEYAESPVVTVSNSINSTQATVNLTFASPAGSSFGNVESQPMSVSSSLDSTQSVRVIVQDTFGNPMVNQTVYLGANSGLDGLWITQVNGTTIQSQVNMGTSQSTAMQTVNTPVPLFPVSDESLPALGYQNVSVGSLTAYNLNSTPVIALTTGQDGTVSITLADGNVQYPVGGAAGYQIDPGTAHNNAAMMYFYQSQANIAGGKSVGVIPVVFAGTSSTPGGGGTTTTYISNASAKFDGLLTTTLTATVDPSVTSVKITDGSTVLLSAATPSNNQINAQFVGAKAGDTLTLTPYVGTTAETNSTVTVQ